MINEWCKRYEFTRNWDCTEEILGIIKYCYPALPYASALSLLYYCDINSLKNYGYSRSFESDLYLDDDHLTSEDYDELILYFADKLPSPFDILNKYDYKNIKPISNNQRHNTSVSDWNMIHELGNKPSPDITYSSQ